MKKLSLTVCLLFSHLFLFAQTKIYEQYASSVIAYSSQYNTTTYSANQILGKPNRFPDCSGDLTWSPSSADGSREFIVVGYSNPQPVNTIRIYQTYTGGGVDTVYLRNASTGTWQTVYTATAAMVTCTNHLLEIIIPTTAYNVDALRIAVNNPAVTSWQEFDAVSIANFDHMNFEWKQYADSVIAFSTQYSTSSWSAEQALGPPNAGNSCSSNGNAWVSLTQNGQREFLELYYAYPARANRVRIFQVDDPGAVDTVYLRNASTGIWQKIFDTTGNSKPCPYQSILEINFTQTAYNVDAVRIALNSPLATGWNEIDAIELVSDLPPNARLSVQSGNWSNTATWSGGIIPTASDNVIIGQGHNVTVDGNHFAKSLFINQGATLTLNNVANSLTMGPAGGGREYLQVQGTLSVTNGALYVNGNIDFLGGSTFNMTAGNIVVDGNNGTENGSVANGIHLFNLRTGVTENVDGGTITIVDPQYNASGQAIAGNYSFGPNTTLKIGNGLSTTGGNNPNGFGGNEYYPSFGHFIMDATTAAGNRHFSNTWSVSFSGNATVTSGELRPMYTFTIGGDLINNATITVGSGSFSVGNDFMNNASGIYNVTGGSYTSVGDDLINNGSFTSGWLYMANNFGISANEQTIGGTGSFNIFGLEPHNNHPNGVTLLLPLTVQHLYFSDDPGKLFIGNHNLTLQQTAYGNPGSNRYLVINGTGRLIIENIMAIEKIFPVGTVTDYTPLSINNGSGHTFSVGVKEGLTVAALNADIVSREWNITDLTGGAVSATLKFQWNAADENAGFNRGASYGGRYNGTSWQAISPYAAAAGTDPYTRTIANVTSFSPFAIASNGAFGPPLAPLPLHLVDFSAKKCNGNVCLQWNTESEINVSHYEIERSYDAVMFERIASSGAQNTTKAQYNVIDREALKGVIYYRLKTVDIDGKTTYSKIVKLDVGRAYTVFISPNPVKDEMYIQGAENFSNILILDITGRLIKQMRPTNNNIYDVKFLQRGMYWIQLAGDKETQTHKLLKE